MADHANVSHGGVLIQERVFNHPSVERLAGAALSTCRVVTIWNEQGEPEVVEFAWRMATSSDAVVDNYSAGGVYWVIDEFETARIAYGIDGDLSTRQTTVSDHPLTGERIADEVHPFGDEILALARAAHRKLENVMLVGWDIAATADGLMLIEMNVTIGYLPDSQLATDGMDGSRFGEILGWHAGRWLERNTPPSSKRRVGARGGA